MKLSAQERAAWKAAFRQMSLAEKLAYILSYYKLPLVLGLIAVVVLASVVSHTLTRKENLLYVAYVNVSAGDNLNALLSDGFVAYAGADPKKNRVYTYTGLYLSENPAPENHEYSYASRLKVLGAVNAKQLDVVLMNRESYDIFSGSGFLLPLSDFIAENAPALYGELAACLVENDVILEDNAIEYNLNEADSYRAMTEASANALELSGFPALAGAGFSDAVYLGVIANSQRLPACLDYITYLFCFSGEPREA